MENTIPAPAIKVEVAQVLDLLSDPNRVVVCETAPAVRVALGELFGMPIGTVVTGKMVSALRALGFPYVFDADFGADVTIWEESQEFLTRLKTHGRFPMFTSCCIGWLATALRNYPDIMPYFSTTKSPLGCLGSLAKTYFAKRIGVDPRKMVVVSIVPCILKKNENQLPFNKTNGLYDVDYSWTTKDLGQLLKQRKIDFTALPDGSFDDPLGESTGGGTVFGRQGGVLESVIRTAYYWDERKIETEPLSFKPSHFSPDIQETNLVIHGKDLRIARVGMVGAKIIVEQIRKNECPYALVEVMACPGGCIMGAGQPMHLPSEGIPPLVVSEKRRDAINAIDVSQKRRVSALNTSLTSVYDSMFDGVAGSAKAEAQLHRKY